MLEKKWMAALAAFTLLGALSACGEVAAPQAGTSTAQTSQAAQTIVDTASAVPVTLSGATATVQGQGATVSGSTVTVTQAGVYRFTGTLADGQIIVDAGKDDAVTLILDGADIACSTGSGIYAKQSGGVVLVLADGSENSVQDGISYTLASGEDEPNAAVFSKDDLTVTGAGTLNVTGNYNNGIASKDDLVIESGTLRITAVNDAVRGRDSVTVLDGALVLNAGSDGIQANNDTDAEKGWVLLSGGTYDITSGNDGVQAETSLTVSGGTFTIAAGGGSANAPAHAQSFGGGRGQPPQTTGAQGAAAATGRAQPPAATTDAADGTATASAQAQPPQISGAEVDEATEEAESGESKKGLKAGTALTISGGMFTVDSSDDSVHANGDVSITGGTFTLSTGDDAIHADGTLAITDSFIVIPTCYEGLEGNIVNVSGGSITLTASDDGVNAAGGSGSVLRISGGELTVNASGDGLDSNGDIFLEGGTVLVNGPEGTGNSALDYDGQCTVTGGTLVAAGSAGMAQSPGSTSTQPVLTVYFTATQAAGTEVTLTDAAGAQVLQAVPQKQFQSIIVSAPQLRQGEAYTLAAAGTTLTSLTLTETVTGISSDGSAVSAATAGGRGMGGAGRGGAGGMGAGTSGAGTAS